MPLEIRPIADHEIPSFLDTLSTAFLERPDIGRLSEEVRPVWDLERTWGAFEERVVGTLRSWPTELTLPGGTRLAASAIAAVTVLPTHRRRGILRDLMAAEDGAARDRGEAVGLLYASEYPIYGRFGYGPACRTATWTIDTRSTGFHGPAIRGVELVAPDVTARDTIRSVFERHRVRQPGEIRRREVGWDAELGLIDTTWRPRWKGFLALHRDGGGTVDGYVRYEAQEQWEHGQPGYTLRIQELHALTDDAYAALWRYCLDVDLVATVVATSRPTAERVPWLLTNARAASMTDVHDGLWVRLLDPARALRARTYDRSARTVLELVDDQPDGGRRQRLALDVTPDGATCEVTRRAADLTLGVDAVAAALLGGTRLRDAVAIRGVDEHRPGAIAIADRLFATLDEPWCSTFF